MSSLYTKEVKQYITTRVWPKGLIFDVEEKYVQDDQGNLLVGNNVQYLQFIFYRHNFEKFDSDAKMQIANTVNEVMTKLRKDGIPTYLEVKT